MTFVVNCFQLWRREPKQVNIELVQRRFSMTKSTRRVSHASIWQLHAPETNLEFRVTTSEKPAQKHGGVPSKPKSHLKPVTQISMNTCDFLQKHECQFTGYFCFSKANRSFLRFRFNFLRCCSEDLESTSSTVTTDVSKDFAICGHCLLFSVLNVRTKSATKNPSILSLEESVRRRWWAASNNNHMNCFRSHSNLSQLC